MFPVLALTANLTHANNPTKPHAQGAAGPCRAGLQFLKHKIPLEKAFWYRLIVSDLKRQSINENIRLLRVNQRTAICVTNPGSGGWRTRTRKRAPRFGRVGGRRQRPLHRPRPSDEAFFTRKVATSNQRGFINTTVIFIKKV